MKRSFLRNTLLVFILCMLFSGVSASAGFRLMPNGKYRYYTSEQTYLSGTPSEKRASVSRWTFKKLTIQGEDYVYCFDEHGYMLVGVQKIYSKPAGEKAGWRTYYFSDNGRLVGIVTDAGKIRQGKFVKTKKGTKYRIFHGSFVKKQWKLIDGYWYYFYSDGIMARNTQVGSHFVNKKGRKVY